MLKNDIIEIIATHTNLTTYGQISTYILYLTIHTKITLEMIVAVGGQGSS